MPQNAGRSSATLAPPTRSRRKLSALVGLVSVALLGGGLTSVPLSAVAAETAAPRDGLVAEYLFTQTTGSSVANTATGSAAGPATVVNGSDAQWTGDSLVLAGGEKDSAFANWVRLPNDLFAGAESGTVTVETRADASMLSAFHFLWNIGSDSTSQYWFASVRDRVRTAITTGGGGGEVNARSGSRIAADRWYSLTSVIDGANDTIKFYVDGAEVASAPTTLTPGSIANQGVNTIGRAPYPDPNYKGEVAAFRAYNRALTPTEIAAVSTADAKAHEQEIQEFAARSLQGLSDVVLTDPTRTLPNAGGSVTWSSSDSRITVAADGRTVSVTQPAEGQPSVTTALTASSTIRGVTASRSIPTVVNPRPGVSTPYGYLMVHFIENSQGYAEKIYLDVSQGDNPERWDPLNGGKPILASQLGTTGVRDPYLTYNPETGTYYIIATDLRVFGGDRGSGSCTDWCYWSTRGSAMLNVWESKDLVNWGTPRQFDVTLDASMAKKANIGMAWAPEATWVPDFDGTGKGRFVLYWASKTFPDATRSGDSYSRILWGSTTDFTQGTYSYGGVFLDAGAETIDTTLAQENGTTYRITKDNGQGKGIYMESTTAARWWESSTKWNLIQTRIGAEWAGGNAGGVEGPAVFKSHSEDRWYSYVDVIPTTGYRPMTTTDLDAGFTQLIDDQFFMAPSTKHGGIVSLTRGQYDTVRAADAVAVVNSDLGDATVTAGASEAQVLAALPRSADVRLAYDRGTAGRGVTWNLSGVDRSRPGTYRVNGTVQTIGANLDSWVGAGGSTAWNASDRKLVSTGALSVVADVVVEPAESTLAATASSRCVAGKGVIAVTVTNTSSVARAATVTSSYGSQKLAEIAPGKSASVSISTRAASAPQGSVKVQTAGSAAISADYKAVSCK